jgi:hypothetical protein
MNTGGMVLRTLGHSCELIGYTPVRGRTTIEVLSGWIGHRLGSSDGRAWPDGSEGRRKVGTKKPPAGTGGLMPELLG